MLPDDRVKRGTRGTLLEPSCSLQQKPLFSNGRWFLHAQYQVRVIVRMSFFGETLLESWENLVFILVIAFVDNEYSVINDTEIM